MLGDVLGGARYLSVAHFSVTLRARYTAANVRQEPAKVRAVCEVMCESV